MAPVRFPKYAPLSEGPENGWHCLAGPLPEKVFIWDREGIYVDCQFPNPVVGHLLGGATVQGKRVTEVLPPSAARQVLKGITRVMKQQEPSQLWIGLSRDKVEYRVCVRLIPSGPLVIGWVNDFLIGEEHVPTAQNGVSKPLSPRTEGADLSDQERRIVEGVLAGQSNQYIADGLGIKEGTVKFHLSNIYRKLHLTSRVQLVLQGPTLLHRLYVQDRNGFQEQESHDHA